MDFLSAVRNLPKISTIIESNTTTNSNNNNNNTNGSNSDDKTSDLVPNKETRRSSRIGSASSMDSIYSVNRKNYPANDANASFSASNAAGPNQVCFFFFNFFSNFLLNSANENTFLYLNYYLMRS